MKLSILKSRTCHPSLFTTRKWRVKTIYFVRIWMACEARFLVTFFCRDRFSYFPNLWVSLDYSIRLLLPLMSQTTLLILQFAPSPYNQQTAHDQNHGYNLRCLQCKLLFFWPWFDNEMQFSSVASRISILA